MCVCVCVCVVRAVYRTNKMEYVGRMLLWLYNYNRIPEVDRAVQYYMNY
jgi:hypothetical protein